MKNRAFRPNRVADYFLKEWRVLLAVSLSGIVYNVGLIATPWFEGAMTGKLVEILTQDSGLKPMLPLALGYGLVTLIVQGSRFLKRFYVRRFANNVNRRMKTLLFGSLVRKTRGSLAEVGVGDVMTRALGDVDDCVEGMRKFTTELFDTGVALLAYSVMLLVYDWRLALCCMIFPPISYYAAEKLKISVQRSGAALKVQNGKLNAETLDRGRNAVTYRVYGREEARRADYEKTLGDYESAAVRAGVWKEMMPPLYRVLSGAGVLFVFWFGQKNVLGTGWRCWDVGAFTTFLSCFLRLSTKSASAGKLFNAVQKAQVSWQRLKPVLPSEIQRQEPVSTGEPGELRVEDLRFGYGEKPILDGICFSLRPGQIMGITGEVASGKSTLGKVFLGEYPYDGSITLGGQELGQLCPGELYARVGYLGHDPELFGCGIGENVTLGGEKDPMPYLKAVCLDKEIAEMEAGLATLVGSGGVGLSGGQAQRLALARTLYHSRPLLILDDPFSALDRQTEEQIFENLGKMTTNSGVILLSHRLYLFPKLSQVGYLDRGKLTVGTHQELLERCPGYRARFEEQQGGEHRGA